MRRETANALREEIQTVTKERPFLTRLERGDYTVTLRAPWTWRGVFAAAKANGQLESLRLLARCLKVYEQEK